MAYEKMLAAYRSLHNGLSDMIEEGRLKESDIPDDYRWLVDTLVKLVDLDPEPIHELTVCLDCGAVEGSPEWGTVGDGFDGYCGSCADKREASQE